MKKKTKKQIESIIGKKIIWILDIPPFEQQCIVCFNGQLTDILKFVKRKKRLSAKGKEMIEYLEKNPEILNEKVELTGARTYVVPPLDYCMIIHHSQTDWLETSKNVSHEVTHLSQYVLRNAQIPLQEETEEVYTYLQAYLLKMILKKIY